MKKSATIDFKKIDHVRFIEAIRDAKSSMPTAKESEWFFLIERIPQVFLKVLLYELELGNNIVSIQNGDWPQEGSIVISLSSIFKNKNWENFDGVKYRDMNDPHYWRADISIKIDNVEHLIIC